MDFPRIKLGIGRPPGQMDVAAYVLGSFSKSESNTKQAAITDALRAVESVIELGLETACSGQRV